MYFSERGCSKDFRELKEIFCELLTINCSAKRLLVNPVKKKKIRAKTFFFINVHLYTVNLRYIIYKNEERARFLTDIRTLFNYNKYFSAIQISLDKITIFFYYNFKVPLKC